MVNFLKLDKTTSQDLSSASLNYTTSYGRKFRLDQIIIHFSVAVSESITITLDAKAGANYDTVLQSAVLVAEQNFVYRPQGKMDFQEGDEIKVQCTNANLTGICYVTIKSSEI